MPQLVQAFDASKIDPTQSAGQLPVGKHPVTVESSEIKATNDGSGGYLQLNLKIADGPHIGETGAYRLNIYNSSAKSVEIAMKQLSAVCHVCHVMQLTSSEQLHGIPFLVEVTPQKENPDKYTEIKRVFDIHGNEPGGARPSPAATSAASPAATSAASPAAWSQTPVATPVEAPAASPAASAWSQTSAATPVESLITGSPKPPWMK